MSKNDKPRIVEAVLTAAGRGDQGTKSSMAKVIENAMAQAVRDAIAEGVSLDNSDELRRRQLAARDKVREGYRKAEAKAAAEVEAKIAQEKADEAARVAAEATAKAAEASKNV